MRTPPRLTTCHTIITTQPATMDPSHWLDVLSLIFLAIFITPTLPADMYSQTDFDGLPGVQHEFKVNIAPGREECFFQMIKQSATLHISFQVLRGADRNVDVMIKAPDGNIVDSHLWTSEGSTDRQIDREGVYAFCIDNTFSRFSSKLVYVFLVTYVVAEWEKYGEDLQQFDVSVGNVTDGLATVAKNINTMVQVQGVSRQHAVTDWYVISSNNTYIQYWSLLMCAVILATGGLQVFFVRRLFGETKATPTAKPRA